MKLNPYILVTIYNIYYITIPYDTLQLLCYLIRLPNLFYIPEKACQQMSWPSNMPLMNTSSLNVLLRTLPFPLELFSIV